jgi:hypothetical protein
MKHGALVDEIARQWYDPHELGRLRETRNPESVEISLPGSFNVQEYLDEPGEIQSFDIFV